MKYDIRVLVLTNRLKVTFDDDLAAWKKYEEERAPINLDITVRESNFTDLKHKEFGIYSVSKDANGNETKMPLYGLADIKERIRAEGTVEQNGMFHFVVFMYDFSETGLYKTSPGLLGHWTYFEPLYEGTTFIEMATLPQWDVVGDILRVLTHEIRHGYVVRARRNGKPAIDVMDRMTVAVDCATKQPKVGGTCFAEFPYYKEFEVFALDGNRRTQDILLSGFWEAVEYQPVLKAYIDGLKKLVEDLTKRFMKQDSPRLVKWAEAIKRHEGWFVGSRSYRNFNPGNFRYAPFIVELGAIGEDRKGVAAGQRGYAIFPTYEKGWQALLEFLRTAQKNQLRSYRQMAIDRGRPNSIPTLADFFDVYAPSSDNNDPQAYAKSVAAYIGDGVTVDTPINQL